MGLGAARARDPGPAPPERLDVLGSALAALALGALTYGLIERAVWAVIAGLVLMAAFVVVERRSRYALVPGSLFASRVFVAANLVTLAVYAALGGVFFLLLLQLQIVSGYSPLAAGVASLPITVLMLLLSSRAGRWAQIHGPRIPMTVGPLLGAGGLLLMLRIGPGASYPTQVLPAVLVFGLGLSALVAPLTAAVLGSVSSDQAGLRRASTTPSLAPASCSRWLRFPRSPNRRGRPRRPCGIRVGLPRGDAHLCRVLLIGAVLSAVMIPRKAAAEETAGESVACQPHCDVTAPASNLLRTDSSYELTRGQPATAGHTGAVLHGVRGLELRRDPDQQVLAPCAATSWAPSGRPVESLPSGSEIAGCPPLLNGDVSAP